MGKTEIHSSAMLQAAIQQMDGIISGKFFFFGLKKKCCVLCKNDLVAEIVM